MPATKSHRSTIDLPYSETDSLLEVPEGVKQGDRNIGNKTLGSFYSFVFIINQIYGPGVLAIPIVFQQGGWFLTTVVLTVFLLTSAFSSTLLCEALSLIPGNKHFELHIEYTGAVKHYFGRTWYIIFQVFLNLCLQSYNIASIIICSQSLDQFFMYIFHKTFALEILPHPGFRVITDLDVLYDSTGLSITAGYLVIMLICLPSGFLNLADNVKIVQLISFIVLVVLMGEFVGQFIYMGLDYSRVPAFGGSYGQLVSIFIFSWAFVMFIPSWVNEKRPDVSVNKVVWTAALVSFLGYIAIGLLAAFAFKDLHSDDILSTMGGTSFPVVTIVASYIFSLGVIAPGIPVCLITTRYNLYVGRVCGRKSSYFFGVVAPWLLAFCFLQGQIFADLLNWSSLFINGIVNFIVPPLLYYKACKTVEKEQAFPAFGSVNSTVGVSVNVAKTESTKYDGKGGVHLDSTVAPWPKSLRPFSVSLTWTLMTVIVALLVMGIGIDLYYLIVKHQNLLASNSSSSS